MDEEVKASLVYNEVVDLVLGSKERVIDRLSVFRNVVDTWDLTFPGKEIPSCFYDSISTTQEMLDTIESLERSL